MTDDFDDRREVIAVIDQLLRIDADDPDEERRLLELRKTLEERDARG